MSCPVKPPKNPLPWASYGVETTGGTLVLVRARGPREARELYYASRISSLYGVIMRGPTYLGSFCE